MTIRKASSPRYVRLLGRKWWLTKLFYPILLVSVVAAVVFVQEGQRRIPVQYARRMVGRRMSGGGSTYMPLRVNMAGVIPVIFAAALLALPQTIGSFRPSARDVACENPP